MKKSKSRAAKDIKKSKSKPKRKAAAKRKPNGKPAVKTAQAKKRPSRPAPVAKRPPGQKKSAAKIAGALIGRVTHYFPQVNAAVVKIRKGPLEIGSILHFKGHTTDFRETLQSMQIDHQPVRAANRGAEVGLGVSQRVREGDSVFKIKAV